MMKYTLSSSVAALMISAVPALATEPTMSSGDTNVTIDQSIDQTQTQDCSGTAMGTDGNHYAMTTTSSGDCVAVQIGVNDVDIRGSFNGPTSGDRNLVINQDVDQEQTQTGGGSGDTTAVQAGGNFVDIRGSFNQPASGNHDENMDNGHDENMNGGNQHDREERREERRENREHDDDEGGNNGFGNDGGDGSPNGKQDATR